MRNCVLSLGCVFLIFASGISVASDQPLVKTYKYQTTSAPPLHIDSVGVWVDKSQAYVGGSVSRMRGYDVEPNDYIKITVTDPQGKVLSCIHSNYFPRPLSAPSSRYGRQPSVYTAKLDYVPPASSTIKVAYVRLD